MEQIENRIDLHRSSVIGAITAVHFVLSVAMFFLSMASGMSRFDGAGPSDLAHLLLTGAFTILSFPLLPAVQGLGWLERDPVLAIPATYLSGSQGRVRKTKSLSAPALRWQAAQFTALAEATRTLPSER